MQFDDGKVTFDGSFNAEDIKKFVNAERIALVTEFNDEVIFWFISNKRNIKCIVFILMYNISER